jgi:hypothetical protein
MAGAKIALGSTSGELKTDGNDNARVNLPVAIAQTGFAAMAGKNDDGTIVTGGRINRIYATEGQAMKTVQPSILWDDTFNSVTQNTANYKFIATTQTGAQTGGFVAINSGASVAANTNSAFQTTRHFPIFGKSELRCNTIGFLTQVPQANNVIEFGPFTATLPGGAIPTDGVFFRYNAAAELRGVINFNGTETQTAAITAPSANVAHDFLIVIQTSTVLFYIDDVLRGTITLLTDAPALGQPMMQGSVPWTMRTYIGGVSPALGTQFKVSDVFITLLGPDMAKPWNEQKTGMGMSAYQGQNGGTMGSTANYANSANPTAAVPTNTTAALGTGLGGQFWETHSLALGTDGIICSYQNPVPTTGITGRNLIIRGISVDSSIQTVLVGGPYIIAWSLAYGHSALSLATAETASFATPSTKAPRRIALGKMAVTAAQAVATKVVGGPLTYRFDGGPIVVAPGEFIALVSKHETGGTVGTTGVIAHNVTFDAYFE